MVAGWLTQAVELWADSFSWGGLVLVMGAPVGFQEQEIRNAGSAGELLLVVSDTVGSTRMFQLDIGALRPHWPCNA